MDELAAQAVQAALLGNWQEAIKINKKILKNHPNDINTLNRLGYAYQAANDLVKSKSVYQKALKLDKYNAIAIKNLERLSLWKGKKRLQNGSQALSNSSDLFLEEPGKTKLIPLINLAPLSTISLLRPSQTVQLCVKRKGVVVLTEDKKYIGALPDDLAFKLMRFLKNHYQYSSFIKSAEKGSVTVFIREIKRGKRLQNQPSFPAGSSDLEYLIIQPLDVQTENENKEKHQTADDDLDDNAKEAPEDKEEEEA